MERGRSGCPAGAATGRHDRDHGTLGRNQDNGYVVADPRVFRVHPRLTRRADTVILTGLGSSDGATVNGVHIDGPCRLRTVT